MPKFCPKCKKSKEVKEFYYFKGKPKIPCKECKFKYNKEYIQKTGGIVLKRYHQSKKGKKAVNEASRRAYENHKEKWIARAKARYAVTKE